LGNVGAEVRLYHAGSTKLATTSTGIDVTGNVSLPDNGKATFGAGDDLQIYHDGSNSIIKDGGTGNLNILAGQLRIKNPTDAESLIEADVNGAVRLYHDNVEKLATTSTGIDVTGTATMDGLTVDGAIAFDSTIDGVINAPYSVFVNIDTLNNSSGDVFQIGRDATGTGAAKVFTAKENGDISFYEDTGTTAKFFWDASAESLGIGTSAPTQKLHVDSGEVLVKSAYDATGTTNSKIYFASRQSGNWRNSYIGNTGDTLTFATGGTGVTHTNATERMRIDSSGNLLVGKSGTNFGAAGIELHSADQIYATSTTHGLALNRLSTDGAIAKFYKDGTTVGSIGVALSDNLYFSGVDAGIGCGTNAIYPATTTGQASPNDTDLGTPSTRFRDLYLSGKVNIASGNIGGSGGPGYDVYISSGTGTNGNGLRCTNYISTNAALPCRGDGASTDNVMDLGTSGTRFRNLYLSGGVYLGGTAGANKLEDYEEGTWTATIADATTGGNTTGTYTGRYTKIGNLVTVFVALTNIDTTGLTAGNVMYVQGLPFTSNVNNHTVGTCKVDTVNLISRTYIYANMGGNDSWLNFQTAGDNIGEANIDAQHITSGTSDIQFTLQYIV
jgi:hypothetical protein